VEPLIVVSVGIVNVPPAPSVIVLEGMAKVMLAEPTLAAAASASRSEQLAPVPFAGQFIAAPVRSSVGVVTTNE
jgi:hypothetical protein